MDGSRTGKAAAEGPFGGDLPASAATGHRAATPGYHGHGARLRRPSVDGCPNALLGRELLEMVLFLALPHRHTKPMAPASMRRFGGFADAIAAPAGELDAVPGFGDAGVTAAVFGIVVHELLVVGRWRHASIRREGLL